MLNTHVASKFFFRDLLMLAPDQAEAFVIDLNDLKR
jgi:hypothetical protein